MFINGLLVAVQQAGLGIELSDGGRVGGWLFADDLCRNCSLTSTTMQVIHKHVNIDKSIARDMSLCAQPAQGIARV